MRSTVRVSVCCLLMSFLITELHAQVVVTGGRRFLQKGVTYFNLDQDLSYSVTNFKVDGEDIFDQHSLNSRLEWNRGFSDNLSVGATDRAQNDVFKDEDGDRAVNREWTFSAGGAYAFNLGGNKQLIAGLQVGYGQIKNIFESTGNEFESKDDLLQGRVKLAYPVQLYRSDLFFVPNASFGIRDQSGDNQDIDTRTIALGLNLYTSIPCSSWWYNEGVDLQEEFRYTSGTQMWGNGTKLRFKSSDITNNFGTGGEGNEDRNRFIAHFDYSYYVTDNFAIGGQGGFTSDTRKDEDSDFKLTTTEFEIIPRLRWHFANGDFWQDVYLEGAGGFRSSKIDDNGSNDENKVNTVIAEGAVGKFWPLTRNLFLNSSVRYEFNQSKDPDDDDDTELDQTGWKAEIGLSYSF